MGSQIVTASVEQRGNVSTNPAGLSPSPSTPIFQQNRNIQSVSENLLQQFGPFSTDSSASAPILQYRSPVANDEVGQEAIIEQRFAQTLADAQGPVLQLLFNNVNNLAQDSTVSRLVEQRNTSRSTDNNPIEQVAKATNNVTVQQFNFIELVFPPCGSIKNPVNTNLLWRIRDFGFPFNINTLIFKVSGIEVQEAPTFSVTDLGNGLELSYDPPEDFPFDSTIEVFVQISDTAAPSNTFTVFCSFDTVPDTRPPIVTNVGVCTQTNVGVTEAIEFDVLDTGDGVDLGSIVVSIEGIPVCSGLSFDALTTASGNGFHVTWDHEDQPLRFGSNVTLSIEAEDLSPARNKVLFICSFDTEPSKAPTFQNFVPEPCDSFVDTLAGLTFEVYGNMHGVDISTLEVRVDNALRRVIVRPRVIRSQ